MTQSLREFITNDSYELLILTHMGPVYFDQTTFRGKDPARVTGAGVIDIDDPLNKDRWGIFEKKVSETLSYVTSSFNKRVVYIIDWPELGIERKLCSHKIEREIFGFSFTVLDDQSVVEQCRIPRKEYDERAQKYKQVLQNIIQSFPSVILVDPTEIFCDEKFCYGIKNNQPLYRDVDHLSAYGSYLVSELIIEELQSSTNM